MDSICAGLCGGLLIDCICVQVYAPVDLINCICAALCCG